MLGSYRQGIAARLTTIWLVVALPLSVVTFVTYAAWYSARLSLVRQERQGYAESTAKSFELLLLEMRLAMRDAGAAIADSGSSPRVAGDRFAGLTSSFPVAYAAFTDAEGRVIRASRPELVGTNLKGDEAFGAAMRSPAQGGIEPSEVTSDGIVGFHVAQLIPERGGRPASVMVMLVDVRRLKDEFPVMVPSGGISIVDWAGQVVFQNEDVRFALARAPWGERYAFVRRALRGRVAVVRDWDFPLGGTRIAVFVPIESIGWAAGSSISPQTAFAPFFRAGEVALPLLLVTAGLSLLTAIGIARRIRRSLERLAEDARRVGSGNLDEAVRADRADEIGEVARSLEAARLELREARQRADQLLEAERERSRLGRSMAEINTDLASSLDIERTLPGVLDRTLAELGGLGALIADRVEHGWRVRHVAGAGAPELEGGAYFAEGKVPALARLLRTHRPVVVPDVRDEPDVSADLAERVGYRAFAAYPLVVRAEVIGAVGVYFAEPRTLSEDELDYMRRMAFAVSLAEESSRVYKAEHRVAETLQTALLAMPEHIPGIDFAHMYHSATEAARVGGDFYDVFAIDRDTVGLTIGDIAGHGIDAAVLTSLVKDAIRVQATQQERAPHEVMAGASQVLYQNSATEVFATVFFGVLRPGDGTLEYCNAGHPAGVCVREDGGVRELRTNSPLIGAFPHQSFELSTDRLGARELLFLYTDGLTEARSDGDMFGEERLLQLLGRERAGNPHRTMRTVVDDVLAFSGGNLTDDLAILVVEREHGEA